MSKKLSTERLGRIRDLSNHGFANLNSQEDLLSHIAAQDAEIAELKKEVRDWRNASLTNNSTIGDRQKVIEGLREQLEKATRALKEIAYEDFRGNRPSGSVKAFKTLQELQEK